MPARRSRSNRRHRQRGGAGLTIIKDDSMNTRNVASEANEEGKALLDAWMAANQEDINKILELFDADGEPIKGGDFPEGCVTATSFNDLYKWTMLPVVRKLESLKPDGQITVTFGIDLRDPKLRADLRAGKTAANANDLVSPLENAIYVALKDKLKPRKFDKGLFNYVLSGPRAKILEVDGGADFKEATIAAICDRPLVDNVTPFGVKYTPTKEDIDAGNVTVSFYYKHDINDPESKEPGTHFIEATGPWHRVTWLETSMMQCVYEAKLKTDLKNENIPYGKWLYGALLRCAKSVAYTIKVQKSFADASTSPTGRAWLAPSYPPTHPTHAGQKINGVPPPMTPALFTGRRTGGMAFILLQNLFHADHFSFITPLAPMETVTHSGTGRTFSLGTSSCDANFILTQKLQLAKKDTPRCLPPAGTHAHELSMVTSILFPDLDVETKATTQVIGHFLYAKYVWAKSGRAGPMPMLPDTLGSRVFLNAANKYTVPNYSIGLPNPIDIPAIESAAETPLISIISSGRQDSGNLLDFKQNMLNGGYKIPDTELTKSMMASEIDDTETLSNAAAAGYGSFGAGGFFGDSAKVWTKATDANGLKKYGSMAVKAVRVMYKKDIDIDSAVMPYMVETNVSGTPYLLGYPVKIGDPSSGAQPKLTPSDKLSIDKNQELVKITSANGSEKTFVQAVKEWASAAREAAGAPAPGNTITGEPKKSLKSIFDWTSKTGRPGAAGGRRRSSRRNNRSSRRNNRRSSRRNNRRY